MAELSKKSRELLGVFGEETGAALEHHRLERVWRAVEQRSERSQQALDVLRSQTDAPLEPSRTELVWHRAVSHASAPRRAGWVLALCAAVATCVAFGAIATSHREPQSRPATAETPRRAAAPKTARLEETANGSAVLSDDSRGPTSVLSDSSDAIAGGGLAAENALYERGRLARRRGALDEAVGHLRQYQQLFSAGLFGPEVSLELIAALREQHQTAEALAEAERFIARFPKEPRVQSVKEWCRQLEVSP